VLGYIFYEELVWERFAKPIVRYIQSLELLKRLDVYLQGVNGTVILIAFVILFLITEIQGIYAGTLLLRGHIFLWVVIYAGKIPIAAFTFWLFRATKPKLMAFAWFKKAFNFVMRMIDWIKDTGTYQNIKTKTSEVKIYIKKNYLSGDDTTKEKFMKIRRRLKIRLKEVFKK